MGMAAAGAALLLTLAACSGTAGTPTGPDDPTTPTVSTTAGSSVGPGSASSAGSGSEVEGSGGSEPDADGSTGADDAPDVTGGGSDMTGDAPDVVSSVTPATFDAQTTAWFAAMCTSLSSVSAIDIPTYPYTTDGGAEPPLEQTRTKALADYAALRSSFTAAVESLDGTPPPTLDGGGQMASDALASLRAMADVAADAPEALGAARTSGELQSAMDDLHDRMRDAGNLVPDDSPLVSDEVTAAMARMPECQPLLGN